MKFDEVLFVSLDDLDSIYVSLDEDNNSEEEIPNLFNEVIFFIFKFDNKTHNQSGSKYTQNMYRNTR